MNPKCFRLTQWPLTAVLVLFLATLTPNPGARADSSSTPTRQPKMVLIACGVVVLAVGAVVIYELCKIKVPPVGDPATNAPPPPVIPPSTNGVPTNAPPKLPWWKRWCSSDFAFSAAQPQVSKLSLRLSDQGYLDNTNPAPSLTSAQPFVTNQLLSVTSFAITNSTDDYLDINNPTLGAAYYQQLLVAELGGLQSGRHVSGNWTNYSIMCWVSLNGMATVFYDGLRQPVCTNYAPIDSLGMISLGSVTNPIPFGFWVRDDPQEFFRAYPTGP